MRTINDDLKDLILAGRGKDRNIEEYASAIGISTAALYRIMNGKIKRPLSDKVLHAIADNAAEGSDVTYESVSYVVEQYLYFKNYADDADNYLTTRSNKMYHAVNRLFAESGIPYAGLDVKGLYTNCRNEPYFDFGFKVVTDAGEEKYLFKVTEGDLPYSGFGYDINLFGGSLMHNGISRSDEWYYLVVFNDHKDASLSDKKENLDNLETECSKFTSSMHEGVLAITPLGREEYHIKEMMFNDAHKSVSLDSEHYGLNVSWDADIDPNIETE